jgi:hypothetical protein
MHNCTLINLVNQRMHSDSQLMHTMLRSHEHHSISTRGTARTTNLPQFHLLCPLILPLKLLPELYMCNSNLLGKDLCTNTSAILEYCYTGVHTLRNPTKKIQFSVIWLAPLCQFFNNTINYLPSTLNPLFTCFGTMALQATTLHLGISVELSPIIIYAPTFGIHVKWVTGYPHGHLTQP